jgi:hypothetical protein
MGRLSIRGGYGVSITRSGEYTRVRGECAAVGDYALREGDLPLAIRLQHSIQHRKVATRIHRGGARLCPHLLFDVQDLQVLRHALEPVRGKELEKRGLAHPVATDQPVLAPAHQGEIAVLEQRQAVDVHLGNIGGWGVNTVGRG